MSATREDDGRDATLAQRARAQGVRMAGVQIGDRMFVFNVPGEPAYVSIDAGRADLFDALDTELGHSAIRSRRCIGRVRAREPWPPRSPPDAIRQ